MATDVQSPSLGVVCVRAMQMHACGCTSCGGSSTQKFMLLLLLLRWRLRSVCGHWRGCLVDRAEGSSLHDDGVGVGEAALGSLTGARIVDPHIHAAQLRHSVIRQPLRLHAAPSLGRCTPDPQLRTPTSQSRFSSSRACMRHRKSATCSATPTSAGKHRTVAVGKLAARPAAARWHRAPSRLLITTLSPHCRKDSASARPSPFVDPVMTTCGKPWSDAEGRMSHKVTDFVPVSLRCPLSLTGLRTYSAYRMAARFE